MTETDSISQETITSYSTFQTVTNLPQGDDGSSNDSNNGVNDGNSDNSSETENGDNANIGRRSRSSSNARAPDIDGRTDGAKIDGKSQISNNNEATDNNKEAEGDPLNIKELALNFDYLLYKINDRYKTLSEQALQSTTQFKDNTEITIMEMDKMIQKYYEISAQLDGLNNDFSKLEQLELIVKEFVPRVKDLARFYGLSW